MTRMALVCAILLSTLYAVAAIAAPLKVITTTTDLAWLAEQIGGSEVQVTPLLTGEEDPHYVDAVPRYIHLVANADAVCIVGMDLEIGWIPKVLSKSANAQVQPGGRGYCEVGEGVDALDVITGAVDRSMGDVHPDGNPHFQLSPLHMIQAGATVLGTLIELQPETSDLFLGNFENLSDKLTQIHAEIQTKLAPLKSLRFIEYHKDFGYFLNGYELTSIGALESVPGVPPSAGRLAKTSISAKKAGVDLLIASNHSPGNVLNRFSSLSNIAFVRVFTSIQPQGEINDFEKLQHHIADQLLQAASKNN